MICKNCGKVVSIKDTRGYISLRCDCGTHIIYKNFEMVFIDKSDFDIKKLKND